MRLPAQFYHEIVAHATEEQPNEVFGLIAGRDGRVLKLWRTTNSDPAPRVRYNVEPLELLQILKEIESQGWTLMAIYHSHPGTSAYPSATDIGLAYYPEAVYIITSLAEKTAVPPAGLWPKLLSYLAPPIWVTTILAIWSYASRLGRAVGGDLLRQPTGSVWTGGRLSRLARGPLGLALLVAASVAVLAMRRPSLSAGPVVRAFKIVDGKVVEEPLVIESGSLPAVSIQRQPNRERSP